MNETIEKNLEAECEIHTLIGKPRLAYISGDDFERIPIMYVEDDGYAIAEGDIVLGMADAVAASSKMVADYFEKLSSGEKGTLAPLGVIVSGQRFRWPEGRVPYLIHSAMPNQERIVRAIRHWEEATPVRFIPRTTQQDYIYFRASTKCSSSVGRVGGRQDIKLAKGCGWGAAVHEIGHAFGMQHEQRRRDRDQYIVIHEENIETDALGNFSVSQTGQVVGPYNYGSVMHYGTHTFSKNNRATITTKPPGITIGRRGELNDGDLQTVGRLLASSHLATPALGNYLRTSLNQVYATGLTNWYFTGKHRLYIRIRGGNADFFQRCIVLLRSGQVSTPVGDADLVLGGGRPAPGSWHALPVQSGGTTYFIGGQYHNNGWLWDTSVQVRREQYEHGVYYTFGFNDMSGEADFNDHIVEVAVVADPQSLVKDFPGDFIDTAKEQGDQSLLFLQPHE
ncbi:MAG: peptidase astacin [Flaviaesturariibacter sp.]|nr:peptidase astacin [Flaviaesturariibacter sp.]